MIEEYALCKKQFLSDEDAKLTCASRYVKDQEPECLLWVIDKELGERLHRRYTLTFALNDKQEQSLVLVWFCALGDETRQMNLENLLTKWLYRG